MGLNERRCLTRSRVCSAPFATLTLRCARDTRSLYLPRLHAITFRGAALQKRPHYRSVTVPAATAEAVGRFLSGDKNNGDFHAEKNHAGCGRRGADGLFGQYLGHGAVL